jgi:hypothetical protein
VHLIPSDTRTRRDPRDALRGGTRSAAITIGRVGLRRRLPSRERWPAVPLLVLRRSRGAQPAGAGPRGTFARPPSDQLLREIEALGYLGVGRRYGVSDNAIRKWRRAYEADAAEVDSAAAVLAPEPISVRDAAPAHATVGPPAGEEARMA